MSQLNRFQVAEEELFQSIRKKFATEGLARQPRTSSLELAKYWGVCPFFLEFTQMFSCQTLELALSYSRGIVEAATKLRQEEKPDEPIIDEDSNAQMDIEISMPEANQSTSNTMPITTESSEDSSFKPVLSKSQKKKQRKREKAESEAKKAAKSSHTSLDPLPRKVVENEASTVITGYLPANNSQAFIRDIIVYDIPAKWNNYTTINALFAWEKIISMTVKRQKKYKTLRVKLEISQFFKNYEQHWMALLMGFPVRWFSASWSLQEQKKRERYQAAVLNPPESMTMATLVHKDNKAYLISHNINMFKEVKLPDGKRKIIGYLSNWDDLYRLINTLNV
ncbi:hypothetical protein RclHR1_10630002 [Rhizophagus clarus]|uniref:Uncharacterized protein n=1 Tax=Rhizophagus clarus TaxID=94130 RepID=A0A2Z6QGR4_9GLOM|nr:hypothetical protein RclHR1_10630002 [Rhizophagus clarus]GES78746.1 hypothetical protein GLOIN_2v1871772 [Rhizophagus clarus]